jgi:hypothetical protein
MRTQNKQKFEYIDPDFTVTEFQTQPIYVVPDYIELQSRRKRNITKEEIE